MSFADTFSQRPSSGPPHHDLDDGWVVPLGKIGGLQFNLSYSIFVAVAVLIGIVSMVTAQPGNTGNGDLPKTALIAIGFWVAGWIVQLFVHLFIRLVRDVPIESLTFGLRGIETRRRIWDAHDALSVTTSTLLALLAVGGSIMLAGIRFAETNGMGDSISVWNVPSFGFGPADHVWISGGWILLVQLVCQAFPLPKSLGRTAIVASISLLAMRSNETFQTHYCRRAIQIVALMTALLALVSLLTDQAAFGPRWPLLMLFAVMLWISSRGHDLRQAVIGFGTFSDWDEPQLEDRVLQPASVLSRVKQSARSIRQRRRLRQAMQQEHQEAEDAGRLDAVLHQLHTSGRESLSPEDLALLQRVSDSLQRERESELEDTE